jgi:hypothetical protein
MFYPNAWYRRKKPFSGIVVEGPQVYCQKEGKCEDVNPLLAIGDLRCRGSSQ